MKTKSILFIIATLIIGFVLGMLTSAQLRIHKLKPVRMYFSEERFREGFYNVIQPDEEQKVVIDEVLNKYAKLNGELQNEFRKDLDVNMKAFRKELDSKLTNEQLDRLKEFDDKREKWIRENRRNRQNDSTDHRYDRRHDSPFRDGQPQPRERRDSGLTGNK